MAAPRACAFGFRWLLSQRFVIQLRASAMALSHNSGGAMISFVAGSNRQRRTTASFAAFVALVVSVFVAPLRPQQPPASSAQPTAAQRAAEDRMRNDWANLERYRHANDSLPQPAPGEKRVVF